MDGEKYVSMFKINGIPILPPLMTAARRREMMAYKELAVALETRLKLEANHKDSLNTRDTESMSTIEDEYLKVSSMLQDHFSPAKLPPQTTAKKVNPSEILKKSDTFIYDINTNTVMIPRDKNVLLSEPNRQPKGRSMCNTKFSNVNRVENSVIHNDPLSTMETAEKAQLFRKNIIPSITIKPPTPESKSTEKEFNHLVTPPRKDVETKCKTQRASTSPSLKESPAPPLLRSNSFTLESPSPVLLQHMVRNRAKNNNMSDDISVETVKTPSKEINKRLKPRIIETIVSNSTGPRKTPQWNRSKPNSAGTANTDPSKLGSMLISNSALFKSKKSPYDIKLTGKPKMLKKLRTPLKKISSVTLRPRHSMTHHHRSRMLIASPSSTKTQRKESKDSTPKTSPVHSNNSDFVGDKIREVEQQHRSKLMELIKKQQDEQRQMQEQFERQQKQLLEEFNAGLMSLKALSVSDIEERTSDTKKESPNRDRDENSSDHQLNERNSHNDSQCYDMTNTLAPSVINARTTPRCNRRLFAGYDCAPASTPRQRTVMLTTTLKNATRIQSPTNRKMEQAATIINAYVRGYFVRRLIRTEYVQTIIQTIRDTLSFALNFHRDTLHDNSEQNILFKARLLQQLTSACKTLRTIFKLPAHERMQLIARDRIYIHNKAKAQNKYKS